MFLKFILSLLLLCHLSSCKILSLSQKNKADTADRQDIPLKAGADKDSEDVAGIPGYLMKCELPKLPTSLSPDAIMECAVYHQEKPVVVEWEVQSPSPVSSSISDSGRISILFQTSLSEQTLELMLKVIITATINPQEKLVKSGNDLLKASANRFRVHARCDEVFAVLVTDQFAQYSYFEMLPFTGCQRLAEALSNIEVPIGGLSEVPPGPTVLASCSNEQFVLEIKQPDSNAINSLGPMPLEACLDLVKVIHALQL